MAANVQDDPKRLNFIYSSFTVNLADLENHKDIEEMTVCDLEGSDIKNSVASIFFFFRSFTLGKPVAKQLGHSSRHSRVHMGWTEASCQKPEPTY